MVPQLKEFYSTPHNQEKENPIMILWYLNATIDQSIEYAQHPLCSKWKDSGYSPWHLESSTMRVNKKANSPMDDLFKQLKIVKFPDMIKIELCKFGYKTANKIVPKP